MDVSDPLTADEPSDRGFTLVEVVVAIVLLGLASLAVLPAVVTGLRSVVVSRDIARATQYASTELASARSLTCAAVKVRLNNDARVIITAPVGYTITTTATGACTSGATYRVSTTVTSTTDTTRSVTATTLILVTS